MFVRIIIFVILYCSLGSFFLVDEIGFLILGFLGGNIKRLMMISLLDWIFVGYVWSFVLEILYFSYVIDFLFYREVFVFEIKMVKFKLKLIFKNYFIWIFIVCVYWVDLENYSIFKGKERFVNL